MKLFSSPKRPDWLWGPPSLLFFAEDKGAGAWSSPFTSTSAEAKNERTYTSITPKSLHGVDWENFTFTSGLALGICKPLRSGGCPVVKKWECDYYHSFHPVPRLDMRRAVGLRQLCLYVTYGVYIKPEMNFISTVIYIYFFLLALQTNSGSWPPFTGLRDHTHWTHHSR
jgi:hypothetical protein